jgi:hypothetical protein
MTDLALGFGTDPEAPDRAVVTVRLDGADLGAAAGRPAYTGFDPDEILRDPSPLLPGERPRRVAVYRCSCGEAGCGTVAVLVSREGDRVVWRDARDYVGVFVGPVAGEEPAGGTPLDLPDVTFDAERYAAEVARAAADRSWETARRVTARLLTDRLRDDERLAALRLTVRGVAPHHLLRDGMTIGFWDAAGGQLLVDVRAPEREPAEWAADLAEELLGRNPDTWDVVFRSAT